MKHLHLYILSALLMTSFQLSAQVKLGEGLEADKTVHNFGDIKLDSGPVSCTFTLTNTSDKPIVIYQVVSSCGCTDVEWTKEPILPGKKGKISATYSNDEGPYPFDKTLTVYVSSIKKPILLKLRGVSVEKPKPLEESYPEHIGQIAFRTLELNCGNLEQGEVKSDAVMVANLSNSPLNVSFEDISPDLDISVNPNPIPARGTAEMSFSVTANRSRWGKNKYWATPVTNGKSHQEKRICIHAFTRESFKNISENDKSSGPRPKFDESTFQAGKVRKGDVIKATFSFKNEGKKNFGVYKVDIDAPKWAHSRISPTEPGAKNSFTVEIDTSDLPEGEMLTIVTLTTNSPLRPIVNLFIAGWIE